MQSPVTEEPPATDMFFSKRRRLELDTVPTLDTSEGFRFNKDYFHYWESHGTPSLQQPVAVPPSTDVTEWQVEDVLCWLDCVCLAKVEYIQVFTSQNINGLKLLALNNQDLYEIIPDSTDRVQVYAALFQLQEDARNKRLTQTKELESFTRNASPGSKLVRFKYTNGLQEVLDLKDCNTLFRVMQVALRQVLPITDRETVMQWALTREPYPQHSMTEEEVMAAIEANDVSVPINVVLVSSIDPRSPPPPTPELIPGTAPLTPNSCLTFRSQPQSHSSSSLSSGPGLSPLRTSWDLPYYFPSPCSDSFTTLSEDRSRAAANPSHSTATVSASEEKIQASPPRNYSSISPPSYLLPSTEILRQKTAPLPQMLQLRIGDTPAVKSLHRSSVVSTTPTMATSIFSSDRPSRRQISMNLQEYFPDADKKELAETLRRSVFLQERQLTHDDHQQQLSKRFSDLVVAPGCGANPSTGSLLHKRGPARTLIDEPAILAELRTDSESDSKADVDGNTFVLLGSPPKPGTETTSHVVSDAAITEDCNPELDLDTFGEQSESSSETVQVPTGWIRGMLIGTGSFGEVFMGINPMNGELMAVKQVEIPTDPKESHRQKMVDTLRHEISLMKNLNHENIVQYRGFESDSQYVNIFLEYVSGGSLASLLSQYGAFQESLARHYARQILNGLAYLHDQGIIHRDIKAANVLVNDRGLIKISDFGLSKRMETQQMLAKSAKGAKRQSMQGSAFWMAPEVVNGREVTGPKADIWSFGCLMIELLTGVHPFPNLTQMQAIFKIGNMQAPEIPQSFSPDLKEFLAGCLEPKSDLRPGAEELLRKPFLCAEEPSSAS